MGLAQSTARFLRDRGHDAVHLSEQNLQRLPDQAIVRKALAEGRVILTHDLDFGRIVALSGEHTPSVITFRLGNMKADNVNRYLADIVDRFADVLENGALISVDEQTIRVRRLPVG